MNSPVRSDRFQSILLSNIGLILLFLPILFYATNPQLSLLGSLLLIVCYLVVIRDTVHQPFLFQISPSGVIFLLICGWYSLSYLLNFTPSGLYNLALCLAGLYLVYFFSVHPPGQTVLSRLSLIALTGLLFLIPLGLYMGYHGGISEYLGYAPYFNRVIFKLMLPFSFFVALPIKRKWIVWLIVMLVYWYMVERTSAILTGLILISYYLFPLFERHRKLLKGLFFLAILFLVVFNGIYIWLATTEAGIELNQQVLEQTSKNLFTGRQLIWKVAWKAFLERPIIGFGFENAVMDARGIGVSTHNGYFYLLMHTGLAGLFLFIGYLYSFWSLLIDRWSRVSHMAMAYLLALIGFLNFELTIVANTMVLGLYYTLAISLGIALSARAASREEIFNE